MNIQIDNHGLIYLGRKEPLKPIPEEELEAARKWLKDHATPIKSINYKHSSYGWKHVAEKIVGTYVSNGALLKAAQELGFTIKPMRDRCLNAYINISEKSYRNHI
jgi:hypothetical protein